MSVVLAHYGAPPSRVKVNLAEGAEVLRLPGTSVEYVILDDENPAVGVINLLLRQVVDDEKFDLWNKEFEFPDHSRQVPKDKFETAYQLWNKSTTFKREDKWAPFQDLAEKEQRAHLKESADKIASAVSEHRRAEEERAKAAKLEARLDAMMRERDRNKLAAERAQDDEEDLDPPPLDDE